MKDANINLRATQGEKARVQALADFFTAGDLSTFQRQLFKATEDALQKHGSRVKWPPVLNYYPAESKTQQDIETSLHLEKDTEQ